MTARSEMLFDVSPSIDCPLKKAVEIKKRRCIPHLLFYGFF